MNVKNVFVAGGQPTITYVPRDTYHLEERLREYLESAHEILSISGQTKSGKTVLVHNIVPKDKSYWVQGGQISNIDVFWEQIILQAGLFNSFTDLTSSTDSSDTTQSISSGIKPGGIGFDHEYSKKRHEYLSNSRQKSRMLSPSTVALDHLRNSRKPLVIDDFHFIERDIQRSIIRSLKSLVFAGMPVVIISVPHREYDVIRAEKEMTARVDRLKIPNWHEEELARIAEKGFEALNISAFRILVDRLARESYCSPYLMQNFCRKLCEQNEVIEKQAEMVELSEPDDWSIFFRGHALKTSKFIFKLLANGPQGRSRRKIYTLRNGEKVDLYKVLLNAISETGPLSKISYKKLYAVLTGILVEKPPRRRTVFSFLERMSNIAMEYTDCDPVLEWDSELEELYISDPFFSFYLRWGLRKIDLSFKQIETLPTRIYCQFCNWEVPDTIETRKKYDELLLHEQIYCELRPDYMH